jgi:hypothetical protein
MLIDCDSCQLRDAACGGCVVTALLQVPSHGVEIDPRKRRALDVGVEIDESERRALDVLAEMGMVPPLRLAVPDERAS